MPARLAVVQRAERIGERRIVAVGEIVAQCCWPWRRADASRRSASTPFTLFRQRRTSLPHRRRRASGAGDIDALEHLVQQSRFAAAARRVESFLQSVVEEVGRVEVHAVVELAGQRADVARIQGEIAADVARHGQRQVLNVRRRVVGVDGGQADACGRVRGSAPSASA